MAIPDTTTAVAPAADDGSTVDIDKSALFRELWAKPENKLSLSLSTALSPPFPLSKSLLLFGQKCFDCDSDDILTWVSVTYGVFLCDGCCAVHRSLGVSSVRSTYLDAWTQEQLKMLSYGGNDHAQAFFKQHGWTHGGEIGAKYASIAADLYRKLLADKAAESNMNNGNNSFPPSSVYSQGSNHAAVIPILKLAEASTEMNNSAVVCSPRIPTTTSSCKNPGNKTGGLGAQRLTSKERSTKVDCVLESMVDKQQQIMLATHVGKMFNIKEVT